MPPCSSTALGRAAKEVPARVVEASAATGLGRAAEDVGAGARGCRRRQPRPRWRRPGRGCRTARGGGEQERERRLLAAASPDAHHGEEGAGARGRSPWPRFRSHLALGVGLVRRGSSVLILHLQQRTYYYYYYDCYY